MSTTGSGLTCTGGWSGSVIRCPATRKTASPLGAKRQRLHDVVTEMVDQGLVVGTSGNASMRVAGGPHDGQILITPSGAPYRTMAPEELLLIDGDGEPVEGETMPSTETALHLAVYRQRTEAGGVVHTHSTYASVLAVAGLDLPPILDEMVLKVGGTVRVAEYAFPSSAELAMEALKALDDRNAVLLRNHGLVGVGRTPEDALEVCLLVEHVARVFVYASLMGRAGTLPPGSVQLQESLFQMQRRAAGHPSTDDI